MMLPSDYEFSLMILEYGPWIMPVMSFGIIGTSILIATMCMKSIQLRMKWWRVSIGLLALFLGQSLGVLFLIDLVLLVRMKGEVISHGLAQFLLMMTHVSMGVGLVMGIIWCLMPGCSVANVKQYTNFKVACFCYFVFGTFFLYIVTNHPMELWVDQAPMIESSARASDGGEFSVGAHIEPSWGGWMTSLFYREPGSRFNKIWKKGLGPNKNTPGALVFLSEDEECLLVIYAGEIKLLDMSGDTVLDLPSLPHTNPLMYPDLRQVNVLMEYDETGGLILIGFTDQDNEPILINPNQSDDESFFYLMALMDHHGLDRDILRREHLSNDWVLDQWAEIDISLVEIQIDSASQ